MSAPRRLDTIHHVVARTLRAVTRKVVILSRRLVALIIAVVATMSLTATALGSPRDVINDYLDNGQIESCHDRADYEAALADNEVTAQYGAFKDVVEQALATPSLVGTPEAPCPANSGAADEGEGSNTGTIALIAVPVGLVIIALALMVGRRRTPDESRESGADGTGGEA